MGFVDSDTATVEVTETVVVPVFPWSVVVLDDPVNTMDFVTMVFCNVLEVSSEVAEGYMLRVHQEGSCAVFSGEKAEAARIATLLGSYGLQVSLEKVS